MASSSVIHYKFLTAYYKLLAMSALVDDFIVRKQVNVRAVRPSRHQLPQVLKSENSPPPPPSRDRIMQEGIPNIKLETSTTSVQDAGPVQQTVQPFIRAVASSPPPTAEIPGDKAPERNSANSALAVTSRSAFSHVTLLAIALTTTYICV